MKRIVLIAVLLMASRMAFAQNDRITGRLVDEGGQPVAFANVVLKSLASDSLLRGTTTGEDGAFSIECGAETYSLVASYVGYERLIVRCEAGDLGILTMNASQLEAVTVTASRTAEAVDRYVVLPKKEEAEAAALEAAKAKGGAEYNYDTLAPYALRFKTLPKFSLCDEKTGRAVFTGEAKFVHNGFDDDYRGNMSAENVYTLDFTSFTKPSSENGTSGR